MTNEPQRTIVDGVELVAALPFVRLLQTILMAMRPSHLLLGLLMVSALMTAGRIWDRFADPVVSPAGLLAGPVTAAEHAAAEVTAQEVLGRYGVTAVPAEPRSDPSTAADRTAEMLRAAADRIITAHAERRAASSGSERDAEDAAYLNALLEIDAVRPRGAFEALVLHCSGAFNRTVGGVLRLRAGEALGGAADLLLRTPIVLWRDHRTFLVIFGLFTMIVVALGGGTISRLAACQWVGRPHPRLGSALDFVASRAGTLFAAQLLPLIMAGAIAAVIWLVGFLLRLPVLDLVGGALYGPALLLGVAVALLLLGYLAGYLLLVPAVVCEGCDAADAQQRAYAYVINRPLHALGYAAVALVGLAVGYLVISAVLVLAINSVTALYGFSGGAHPALGKVGDLAVLDMVSPVAVEAPTGTAAGTATLLRFWQTVALSLAPAYVLAYVFAASTLAYLLLRRACDGQDLAEIWTSGPAESNPDHS